MPNDHRVAPDADLVRAGVVPGKRLGPYVLRHRRSAGGMGAVYVAEHELMGRRAAVKVLLPQYLSNADMIKRFVNEARAAAAVKHPGIVEIYDVNYADSGMPYIAMELLEGQDLGERLQQGELDRASAFAIAGQIAEALEAAHRAGVVHRDLKPGNVFLRREATTRPLVKLLDFGVAKVLEGQPDDHMTQTGMIVGTPSFMSPEQCRSQPVDHRTDLYALGCIVFRLVAGHVPFRGESTFDVIAGHVTTPAPALSSVARDVSPALDALVARLLAKVPADRPASAGEVVPVFAELEAAARPPRAPTIKPTIKPDVTLPTARIELLDDAPTKQTMGVAQLAALAQPRPQPRPEQGPPATTDVGQAPARVDEIEQMPSMLLVPEDLAAPSTSPARPAASPRPLPGVAPRPRSSPSPAPLTPPPAPPPPAPPPPPPARSSSPSSPTSIPQMPSTVTLSSGEFAVPEAEAHSRWRIWLVSALAFIAAGIGVSAALNWLSADRDRAPSLAVVAPADASVVVSMDLADARGMTSDDAPVAADDDRAAEPPAADAAVAPPPSEIAPSDDDGEAVVDLDAIELGGTDEAPRGKPTRLRDAGPTPADVLLSEELRDDARAARLRRAYVAEHDLLYQASRLDPRRRDLLDLGDAARLGGNTAQAKAYYERFLRSAPPSRDADIARSRLAAIARAASGAAQPQPAPPTLVAPVTPGTDAPAP